MNSTLEQSNVIQPAEAVRPPESVTLYATVDEFLAAVELEEANR